VDADRAHAFVARCLSEPAFLAAPRADETAVFEGADLKKLALFAGFITKVKHNPLRTVLPCTFRLLALLGAEIDFFAAYAPAFAEERAQGALSDQRRIELLGRQLDDFVAERPAEMRALLRGVLLHESTVHRLTTTADAPDFGLGEALRWRGGAAFNRYGVDVGRACAALRARRFDFATDVVLREQILLYRRMPDRAEVAFFEADELTWLLLSLVDGRRSAHDVAAAVAALGFGELVPARVEEFFADAAAQGFITSGAACA